MVTWTCSNGTVLSHPHNSHLWHEKRIMGEMKPQTNSVTCLCDMRAFVRIQYLPSTLLSLWALHSYYRHSYIHIILLLLFSQSIALQCLSLFLCSLNTLHQLKNTVQPQWIRCLGLLWLWTDVLEQIWTMNIAWRGLTAAV